MAVKEHRWIVLSTDGRHVTLGRHSDPTEAEILAAEDQLAKQGLAGWLAVVEGAYWSKRTKLSVLAVRPLAHPTIPFDEALRAFQTSRSRALAPA